MRIAATLLLPFLLSVGGVVEVWAQGTQEYVAKVVLLEKLTAYVEWPTQETRPFVLGVVGRSPFGDELDSHFRDRLLKGRAVQIRYYRGGEDPSGCDLLFICASEKERLGLLLSKLRGRPILTLGDSPGYAQGGVMVNLVREGPRLGFEVNVGRAKDSNLRISSGFLKLAKVIE